MTNIVFFGSSKVSIPVLEKLLTLKYLKVVACVTQPDRPIGRKRIITPTPVSDFANTHKIPVLKPQSDPNNYLLYKEPQTVIAQIKKLRPDLIFVIDYGLLIPAEIIQAAPKGGINIHFSLLPKYKGAAPIEWAIINGEKETGITIQTLGAKIDSGKIIAVYKEPIAESSTSQELYQKLAQKSAALLEKTLPLHLEDKITLQTQDESQASYAPRLTRANGQINWKKSDAEIERMIRALNPWPGVWTMIRIKNHESRIMNLRLKILKAHLEKGKLILDTVQLEGKNPVSYKDFITGHSGHSEECLTWRSGFVV